MFYNSFIITLILAIFFTISVKWLAKKWNIIDKPDQPRKIHGQAVPLLGGLAVFFSFFAALFIYRDFILDRGLIGAHLISFFIGAGILMVGGFLDDKYNLKPRWQIIFPLLAVITVLIGGISIEKITNPLGGLFYFTTYTTSIFTFIWLLGMMYTTKLLDGVDGLVSGLGIIAGVIIFLFTITTKYYQPDVGLMALIFAAACLGFLVFNFHPAKIFLGEGGSLLVGYIIGVLAIISGGKIAIALLIMGIPIMDVAWIIIRRLWQGKNPFKFSDRKHLHHRFLDIGLNQKQTALVYYALAAIFGASALFLQSQGKIVAMGALVIIMVIIAFVLIFLPDKKNIDIR